MITAKMVQDLREKTGAGMMDCKKALVAADGDMELAIENLRKSGAAKAEKKSGRATNQGKVLTKIADGKAAIVEVLCETDFAAKTDKFGAMVDHILDTALAVDGDGDVTAQVNEIDKDFPPTLNVSFSMVAAFILPKTILKSDKRTICDRCLIRQRFI